MLPSTGASARLLVCMTPSLRVDGLRCYPEVRDQFSSGY